MRATGLRVSARAWLAILAIVAVLIGTIQWAAMAAQQQKMVHGVFAGFEPKPGQERALLSALQTARGQLGATPGTILTNLYERVGDQQPGATKYLFIATFENMSYVKSAAKNQQLVSTMTLLNSMCQYSRVRIINLKAGKVPDTDIQ